MNANALLLLFLPVSTLATVATVVAQDQARPRLVHHRIVAGDFDGDGRAEVVTWDSRSQQLTVVGLVGGKRQQLANHRLDDFPTAMRAADLDGDGKDELVVGSGRRGYNRKGQPVVDVRVRVYRPLGPEGDGWTPEQVFKKASDRPTVTALEVADLDRDRRPELLFACFVAKYFTEVYVAHRRQDGKDRDDGAAWSVQSRGRIRMGMNVIAADAVAPRAKVLVVGRPYGEKLGDLGDAFLLPAGKERVPLPAFRGVSALAAGDIDGDGRPELVVGDGWHQNYGRLARARLTVIRRVDGAFQATPVEDLPAHIRIVEILVRDLDGDGRGEILARGARSRSLGGDVRLYQRTTGGWRGRTLATDVQGFAIGSFTGGTAPEIVVAGGEPTPQPVSVGPDAGWDAQLAAPTNPVDVDAKTLVGKPAPALQVDAWLGGAPCKLLDLRGKVVLLDFWATWCKPCIAGFPTLRGWRKKFGADK
ncbi:MAG: FG-GAP-like repeat-containing protein, partial [Planctomycetota bacterium]